MKLSFLIGSGLAFDALTAGKVLGLLTAVFTILQALKKAFPSIGGWGSVVLNIALSVIGAVVILPAGQFFSVETLTIAIVAGITAAGAAGIHGTIKNLGSGSDTGSSTVASKVAMIAILALLVQPLAGCGPFEQTARDTIATLGGLIKTAQAEYQAECTANPSEQKCVLVNEAIRAHKLTITGLEIYCGFTIGSTLPEATCTPIKSALAAVEAAVANLKPLIGQLTALLQNKSSALDRARDTEASLLASWGNQLPTYDRLESARIEAAF